MGKGLRFEAMESYVLASAMILAEKHSDEGGGSATWGVPGGVVDKGSLLCGSWVCEE